MRAPVNILTRRHLTTILFLLRGYAQEQRRSHGKLVEREGGIQLTPTECEQWADILEDEGAHLPQDTTIRTLAQEAAREMHAIAERKIGRVVIQPKVKTKRGKK